MRSSIDPGFTDLYKLLSCLLDRSADLLFWAPAEIGKCLRVAWKKNLLMQI